MAKIRVGDVIVVLPGITGSVLQRDGEDIWAFSCRAIWAGLNGFGRSILDLRLEGGDDFEADDLGDGIRATGLVQIPRGIAGLAKSDGYASLRRLFVDQFDLIDGSNSDGPANYLEFAYDWRRDNRAAAHRLKRLLDRRLPQWRDFSGNREAKAVLVAHSMGGLVGRYYAEVLGGWRDCRALITLGTPHRGSVDALRCLGGGYRKLGIDLTALLRSFPSVYQLLPIYEMLTVEDRRRRVAEVDGLPGVDRTLAERALEFHRAIEAAVDRNRADPDYSCEFVTIPVVGIGQPTLQSASFAAGQLLAGHEPIPRIAPLFQGGDGTVARVSAVPIELGDDPRLFTIAERHSSLQRNGRVLDWLREAVRQMQGRDLREIRGPDLAGPTPDRSTLGIDLDDVYVPDESITISANLAIRGRDNGPPLGRIMKAFSDDTVISGTFREAGDAWIWDVGCLAPGVYSTEVRPSHGGLGAPTPVHDVFEVQGDREIEAT